MRLLGIIITVMIIITTTTINNRIIVVRVCIFWAFQFEKKKLIDHNNCKVFIFSGIILYMYFYIFYIIFIEFYFFSFWGLCRLTVRLFSQHLQRRPLGCWLLLAAADGADGAGGGCCCCGCGCGDAAGRLLRRWLHWGGLLQHAASSLRSPYGSTSSVSLPLAQPQSRDACLDRQRDRRNESRWRKAFSSAFLFLLAVWRQFKCALSKTVHQITRTWHECGRAPFLQLLHD